MLDVNLLFVKSVSLESGTVVTAPDFDFYSYTKPLIYLPLNRIG